MVRLKVDLHMKISAHKTSFQFHYGTIKRLFKIYTQRPRPEFQFHYGTIKSTILSQRKINLFANFNSIMVRLKVKYQEDHMKNYLHDFNSIMVRLKVCLEAVREDGYAYFNSIMVRLKVSMEQEVK